MADNNVDTIAAIATPPGYGGIGIIRVSGPDAKDIANKILQRSITPRTAAYSSFYNSDNDVIDEGVAIYFPGPASFTGEDVLELQGHGGPVVLDQMLSEVYSCGARPALPGEFSKRAFLNDKMDLTQAEAIADLINANTAKAASSAMKSLQGVFSNNVSSFLAELVRLRVFVESSLDFTDEEIDFLSEGHIVDDLNALLLQINKTIQSAKQGLLLQNGFSLVILGEPNAGKSSLLNTFTKRESAIVTDIPGTTRDVLRESIQINGVPVHLIDTAGLRVSGDVIEQEGIKRAWNEVKTADIVMIIVDSLHKNSESLNGHISQVECHAPDAKIVVVFNKIDLIKEDPSVNTTSNPASIAISIKDNSGIDQLKSYLLDLVGYNDHVGTAEGEFSARNRHIESLKNACSYIKNGLDHYKSSQAVELLAEDLKIAQRHLSEITGAYSNEDLLGDIFSSFCIGK